MSLPLTTSTSSSALSGEDFFEETVPLKRPWAESYFHEIGEVVGRNDIADGDDFDVLADETLFDERAEDEATDASEPVNCDFDCHTFLCLSLPDLTSAPRILAVKAGAST
jgi:hypothetical protein